MNNLVSLNDNVSLNALSESLHKEEENREAKKRQEWNNEHADFLRGEGCVHCKWYNVKFSCGRPVKTYCELKNSNVDGSDNHCKNFVKVDPPKTLTLTEIN